WFSLHFARRDRATAIGRTRCDRTNADSASLLPERESCSCRSRRKSKKQHQDVDLACLSRRSLGEDGSIYQGMAVCAEGRCATQYSSPSRATRKSRLGSVSSVAPQTAHL